MRTRNIKDMSLSELRQELMKTSDAKLIKMINAKIKHLEKENQKTLEMYEKSSVLKFAGKVLHKQGKTNPIISCGVVVGHEYDLCEAILVLHELLHKKEERQNDHEKQQPNGVRTVRELVNS